MISKIGLIDKVYVHDASRLERSVEVGCVIKKIFHENNVQLYTETGLVDLNSDKQIIKSFIVDSNKHFTKHKLHFLEKRFEREGYQVDEY